MVLIRKKWSASPRCQDLFLTEVCEAWRTDNSWEFRKGVNQAAGIHVPRKKRHRWQQVIVIGKQKLHSLLIFPIVVLTDSSPPPPSLPLTRAQGITVAWSSLSGSHCQIRSYWQTDCCCFLVAMSCPTLWDPMNYSPPGSSVYGIIPARLLEWGAISSSRGSSWPRDWTLTSYTGRWFFTTKPPGPRLPTPEAGELFFNVPIFLSQDCYQPIDLSLRGLCKHHLGAFRKLWESSSDVPNVSSRRGCSGVPEGELRCWTSFNSWEVQTRREKFYPKCHNCLLLGKMQFGLPSPVSYTHPKRTTCCPVHASHFGFKPSCLHLLAQVRT